MFTRGRHGLLMVLAFLGAAAAGGATAFPVGTSADKRTLVDRNGAPFPILGRTSWFLTSLSAADQRMYIDDTASRGYTVVEFHVINHDSRGNNAPFNGAGDLPFLKRLNGTAWNGALTYANIGAEAPDLTTPNEAFWTAVDSLLAYCASKGILVFMFPGYVGARGGQEGWMQEMAANGGTKMRAYGAWIATRYKDQGNIVWMMGGDMTDFGDHSDPRWIAENALLQGLKSVAGQKSTQFSAEWNDNIGTDQPDFGPSMTLNGVYQWEGDVTTLGRRAYAFSPVLPAYLLEEPYDEEGCLNGTCFNGYAGQPVRRFQWWGWLSTIGGYVSGNGYVWPFRSNTNLPTQDDWRNHLDTPNTRDMARLNAFIGSISWYKLVPSGLNGMRTLITAGGGTFGGPAANDNDYVSAAATPDGTLLVAYVPPAHAGPVTVDMSVLAGPVQARWFDPTTGIYAAAGSGLPNAGTRSFTVPSTRPADEDDAVLVLEAAGGADGLAPARPKNVRVR